MSYYTAIRRQRGALAWVNQIPSIFHFLFWGHTGEVCEQTVNFIPVVLQTVLGSCQEEWNPLLFWPQCDLCLVYSLLHAFPNEIQITGWRFLCFCFLKSFSITGYSKMFCIKIVTTKMSVHETHCDWSVFTLRDQVMCELKVSSALNLFFHSHNTETTNRK